MQIRAFFEDREAVSPVIGVILMVAITVILAAVIGTFVLGLGDQVGESAPNAQFEAEQLEEGTINNNADPIVEFRHTGGDSVDTDTLSLNLAGNDGSGELTEFDPDNSDHVSGDPVSAGDTVSVYIDNEAEITAGSTISLNWESGDRSSVLRSFELPKSVEYDSSA